MLRFSAAAACLASLFLLAAPTAQAQQNAPTYSVSVRQNYRNLDRLIPMRDGVKLYTVIYVPIDATKKNRYPFLLERTPYSAAPYGETNYPKTGPGTSRALS